MKKKRGIIKIKNLFKEFWGHPVHAVELKD